MCTTKKSNDYVIYYELGKRWNSNEKLPLLVNKIFIEHISDFALNKSLILYNRLTL